MKRRISAGFLCIMLIVLDQAVKALVRAKLIDHPLIIWKDVFSFTYLENRGSMWGLFQGKYMILAVCSVIVTALLIWLYLRIPETKRFLALRLTLILLVSGAVGNFIDRIFFHYVTDFISFDLINFPIFNIADIYVTVSAFSLILLIGFIYKDEELTFLPFSGRKENNAEKKE